VGRSTFDLHQDTDSFAIFGQVTWHISDRIRANLGLRYTKDEKELDFSRVTTGALPFPTYTLVDEREDSDTTPSINIQADISDNVMVYASFSQGFKSGGFDFESGADFEEETVDAWEIGFKSMLFEGSVELNAAMFQSEFDDLQVAAWNGIAFETGNAAKATTKGLEIDGRWQITDSWMVWGAVAYLNAEYDRFPGATCTASQQMVAPGGPNFCQQDLTGGDLQFSPDWSGTLNLDYILQMGDFELTASLGVDYSADFFTALDLDPISQQGSYVKVNMRVELAADAGWSVALVGKNLTDEETTMWVNDVPFFRGAHFAAYDQSRNFGIQARYEF
jgi:outer membrane receptor protein involved in Fe transport